MTRRWIVPVLAGAGLLSAACGGAVPAKPASKPATKPAPAAAAAPAPAAAKTQGSASSAAAKPLQRITVRLPYLMSGYDVPFAAAKELGYYKAAGFDATIGQGKGSATTVETVANGSDTFGVADAGTAAELIAKGAPVKMLAVYVQNSPESFAYNPANAHLSSPVDLKGKTIISFAGDAQLKMLPAVLARYHMTMSDVKVDLTQPSAIVPLLAKTPGAYLLLFKTDLPRVTAVIPGAKDTLFSKFGINVYSIGTLTDLTMLKDHPGEVRRFMAASQKGWAYSLKHPQQALSLALKAFPSVSPSYLKGSWAITTGLLHTPATKGHPVGWMSSTDWKNTVSLLHRYAGMSDSKPLSAYYTDSFIGS